MFRLINDRHEEKIRSLAERTAERPEKVCSADFTELIEMIRADIPEKKRSSYGRYSVIKALGYCMYPEVAGNMLFDDHDADPFVRSLGIQLISIHAERGGPLDTALDYFEKAAADDSWEVRECSAGFIRKLIKRHPKPLHAWYLKLVCSDNPLKRRFAGESLRPVADNGWFKTHPEFAWSIIKKLFHETEAYPRTTAGNSLSDWMRVDPGRTLPVVKELAANGDMNSYWIAYRACRNLVKKDPLLVMDILGTDHYKYKNRNYSREG